MSKSKPPKPAAPRPTLGELSEDERRTSLAEARKWQPDRPPERVAYWRGYVERKWEGTALDDEQALLVVGAGPFALQAAMPLYRAYVAQVAKLKINFPKSDVLRRALAREESSEALRAALARAETERAAFERAAIEGRQLSDDHRAVFERAKRSRGFALDWIANIERLREACLTTRLQAQVMLDSGNLDVPPDEAFGTGRADAVHRLRHLLRERHPADAEPSWPIVAAFMWYIASWNVDPDKPRTVETLRVEYAAWRKKQGLPALTARRPR